MREVFYQLQQFDSFEDRLATTITTRLGLEPNINQIEAWKCRERAETFLRPDIVDNDFSIELSSSMAQIILRSLNNPLDELTGYRDNGWELRGKRTGLTRSKAEELDDLKVLFGFSCQVDFFSFNYPCTRTKALIWYTPASYRSIDEGNVYVQPNAGGPHINRIATKFIFENGATDNIDVLRKSRQNSGALQRQGLKPKPKPKQ